MVALEESAEVNRLSHFVCYMVETVSGNPAFERFSVLRDENGKAEGY